ncbi:MFS family permease [Granulicella aggregans]|uniref:MFS family permease n=1 Tax=Granulicella aggregans TaxID=474949 RepID=A0A7W8E5Y5_9BACT|nr:MFS transporter [Granulicella aggregans]MBB5060122.1 MFS family permease [Granulicella aggregans]
MTQPAHASPIGTVGADKTGEVSRAATLAALTLASAAETWTTSGVSLTLTDLTGTLSASSDQASWALTVYMAAFAVSIALSDRLSLKYGNRHFLTALSLSYAVASVGCALSTDLSTFLLFRAIAGFAGGAFLVRAFVFFTQQYEATVRPTPLVGYAIAYFFVGRFLSPVVCGWLADVASWRFLFGIPTILMLTAAWLFDRYGANHWAKEDSRKPLDSIGIGLLILGAICLQPL